MYRVALMLSACAWAAQCALIPLTDTHLDTGDTVLLEFAQLRPDKWQSGLEMIEFLANLPDVYDYGQTALHVQFESPDGSVVRDGGMANFMPLHFYAAAPGGPVFFDYMGTRTWARLDGALDGLMAGPEMRVRIRITNEGVPLTFGHRYWGDNPMSYLTWGETAQAVAWAQGAGDPVGAWRVTRDVEAAVPEPNLAGFLVVLAIVGVLHQKRNVIFC